MTHTIKEDNKSDIHFCQKHLKVWEEGKKACCKTAPVVGWIEKAEVDTK